MNTNFVLSSIYWIRRKSSSINLKGNNSVSDSVASNATVNLLVDFDRAEILNMKEDESDERRYERTVILLRYIFITKF